MILNFSYGRFLISHYLVLARCKGERHRTRRLFTVQAASAAIAGCILLGGMNGAALAQTTGPVSPNASVAKPSPANCMPFALTASGEMVFPISCKEIVEQRRGKDVEQKAAALQDKAEDKPAAAGDQPAVKQEESVAAATGQPAGGPAEPMLPLPKPLELELHGKTTALYCTHFKSFDPASGTYRGYDGQRHSCRRVGALSSKF